MTENNDRSDEGQAPRVVLALPPSETGDSPARVVLEVVHRSGDLDAESVDGKSDGTLHQQLVAGTAGAGTSPHLAALQRIADENGGNRASPSPGYDASVEYVVEVLTAAGYDVSTPTYPLPKRRRREGEKWCRQVVAQTRTGDPDRVVLIGAHLDSVRKGPGINDNGSGVSALLEIATQLGGSPLVRNAVRFGFWGSEEDDLKGSIHYAKTLTRRDRDDILAYVNVDMVASPNAGYFVLGGEGKSRKKFGPPGSGQVVLVLVEQLAAAGVVARTVPLDDESDYAPFVEAGIPTAGVMAGDTLKKTEKQAQRWGGKAGVKFDPNYHTPRDRLEALDRTVMQRFTRALAGTVAQFAMTTDSRPR
ncbi:M28 family peptidase [Pseudonocardia xinjiangensis]|uniref:M28 family peptidase n=1 Tax=Pseudonocardia xinjiangensis TaxID=75289 RepID=UPI003D942BAC